MQHYDLLAEAGMGVAQHGVKHNALVQALGELEDLQQGPVEGMFLHLQGFIQGLQLVSPGCGSRWPGLGVQGGHGWSCVCRPLEIFCGRSRGQGVPDQGGWGRSAGRPGS